MQGPGLGVGEGPRYQEGVRVLELLPAIYDAGDMLIMLALAVPTAYVSGIIRERYRKRRRYELPRY